MTQTVKEYVVELVHEAARSEVKLNELYRRGVDEKNVRLWIALVRKVLADRVVSGTETALPGNEESGESLS